MQTVPRAVLLQRRKEEGVEGCVWGCEDDEDKDVVGIDCEMVQTCEGSELARVRFVDLFTCIVRLVNTLLSVWAAIKRVNHAVV